MDYDKIVQEMETSDSGLDTVWSILKDKSSDQKKILDSLKKRMDFYKQQNDEMDNLLKKFKSLNRISDEANRAMNELVAIQEKFGCLDVTPESTLMSGLSVAERQRKQNRYISKIKLCTKMFISLNKKLSDDIKVYKRELEFSENKLEDFKMPAISAEIKSIESKINKYEKEISKLEMQNPWLNNPQMNLANITNKIETLNQLRFERDKLKSELQEYQDLKPDMSQACEQLAEIKEEYEKYNKLAL